MCHRCVQQGGEKQGGEKLTSRASAWQVHVEYTSILSGSPPKPSPVPTTATPNSNGHTDEAAPAPLPDVSPPTAPPPATVGAVSAIPNAAPAVVPVTTLAPVGGLGGERLAQGPRRTNAGGAWGKGKVVSEIGSNRGVNGSSNSGGGSSGGGSGVEGRSGVTGSAWGGVTGQQATGWAVGEGGGLGSITAAAVSAIPSSADAAVHVAAGNGDANELAVGSSGF